MAILDSAQIAWIGRQDNFEVHNLRRIGLNLHTDGLCILFELPSFSD